jgi:acyl-CoA synthetase (AMP-forming)/AMP-acid ligase II
VQENDPANICYTSGTTADPKGIVLTHRNYTANVEQASGLLPIPQHYVSLLILPWDHSFAHTAGIYTLMKNGASLASTQIGRTPMESLRNIPLNIRESRPVFLLSVPSLAQNFRKNIEKGIRQKGKRAEKLFQQALKAAYRYNGLGHNRGKGLRALYKPLIGLYDKILFSKIRENFGGRLEFFIGGGALLDIELQKFFYALGIPMLQGYGLSEASPIISANVPKCHKLGSSGQIAPNVKVKICDENGREIPAGQKGEIVVQGKMSWRVTGATKAPPLRRCGTVGSIPRYRLHRLRSFSLCAGPRKKPLDQRRRRKIQSRRHRRSDDLFVPFDRSGDAVQQPVALYRCAAGSQPRAFAGTTRRARCFLPNRRGTTRGLAAFKTSARRL